MNLLKDDCRGASVYITHDTLGKLQHYLAESESSNLDELLNYMMGVYSEHIRLRDRKMPESNTEIKPNIKSITNAELLAEFLLRLDEEGFRIDDNMLGGIVYTLILNKSVKHGA